MSQDIPKNGKLHRTLTYSTALTPPLDIFYSQPSQSNAVNSALQPFDGSAQEPEGLSFGALHNGSAIAGTLADNSFATGSAADQRSSDADSVDNTTVAVNSPSGVGQSDAKADTVAVAAVAPSQHTASSMSVPTDSSNHAMQLFDDDPHRTATPTFMLPQAAPSTSGTPATLTAGGPTTPIPESAVDGEVSFLSGITSGGTVAAISFSTWNHDAPASYASYSYASKWGNPTPGTPGGTVTYWFDAGSNWTTTEENGLVSGLSLWSAEANINFSLASSATAASLTFVRGTDGSAVTESYGGYTAVGSSTEGTQQQVTISIDTSVAGFGPIGDAFNRYGGYPYDTLVHEEGHMIGFGHGGPYNAGDGLGTVPSRQYSVYDSRLWTIMSYIRPTDPTAAYFNSYPVSDTVWPNQYDPADGYYAQVNPDTPMILDILGAQRLYGAPTSGPLTTGGTVFGFNCNIPGTSSDSSIRRYFDFTVNTAPIVTIWDSGTGNTLDLSGYSTNETIDLTPGTFSSCDGFVNNIAIAYGTVVSTAIGGAGNDTIIGSTGNDVLEGGLGADTLTGGGGTDEFAGTAAELASDTITDFAGNDKIWIKDANPANIGLKFSGDVLQFDPDTSLSSTYDSLTLLGVSGALFKTEVDAAGGVDIVLSSSDTQAPTITVDNPLTIQAGSTQLITSSLLSASDNVSAGAQLVFTIITAPLDGVLLLSGSATTSFTQADLDNGLVSYEETTSGATSDDFFFTVTDAAGNATAKTAFAITIGPAVAVPTVSVADYIANQVALDAMASGFAIADTAANIAADQAQIYADDHIIAVSVTDGAGTLLGRIAFQAGHSVASIVGSGIVANLTDAAVTLLAGAQASIDGAGNTVDAGANDFAYLLDTQGIADAIQANGDTGTTAAGQTAGIKLADDAQANVSGSGNLIALGQGDSLAVDGAGNTIYAGANDLEYLFDTQGIADAVQATGDSGTTAVGQGAGIQLADDAQANVSGSGNLIVLGQGDSLAVDGAGNTIYAGANDLEYLFDTQGIADTINANGDSGATVVGQVAAIQLANNTQSNVTGSGNTIVLGQGDSLAVDGAGETITAGANDLEYLLDTQGTADTINANGDSGTTAVGQGAGILLASNTQANVTGSGNVVFLIRGDSLAVDGGGNTVYAGANDLEYLLDTRGIADAIQANGDSGTTAVGQSAAIQLADNAQGNVTGSTNTIVLGQGDSLAVDGGGNTITAGANDFAYLLDTQGNADTVQANGDSGTTAVGQGAGIQLADNTQANVNGTHNNITLGANDTLGASGGSNTVFAGSNDTINDSGTNDTIRFGALGFGNTTFSGFGAGDVFSFSPAIFASYADLQAHVSGSTSAVITDQANDKLTLTGVAPSRLAASMFSFS